MKPKEQLYKSLEEEIEKLGWSEKGCFVIHTIKYEDILCALKLQKGELCSQCVYN